MMLLLLLLLLLLLPMRGGGEVEQASWCEMRGVTGARSPGWSGRWALHNKGWGGGTGIHARVMQEWINREQGDNKGAGSRIIL
jgi:hypothetical protein